MSEGMAIRSKWRALFVTRSPQAITAGIKGCFSGPIASSIAAQHIHLGGTLRNLC
jgi:hypothetical protein